MLHITIFPITKIAICKGTQVSFFHYISIPDVLLSVYASNTAVYLYEKGTPFPSGRPILTRILYVYYKACLLNLPADYKQPTVLAAFEFILENDRPIREFHLLWCHNVSQAIVLLPVTTFWPTIVRI